MVGMAVTPHKLEFSADSLAHVVPFQRATPAGATWALALYVSDRIYSHQKDLSYFHHVKMNYFDKITSQGSVMLKANIIVIILELHTN